MATNELKVTAIVPQRMIKKSKLQLVKENKN